MPAPASFFCIWAFEKVQVYNPRTFITRIAVKFIEKDCVFLKQAFGGVAV